MPLHVENLTIAINGGPELVRDVSFDIEPGGAYGLVGESGSGKTLTCRSILGLLPSRAQVGGRIVLGNQSLLELSKRARRELRGAEVGMVFQDPMTALNPVLRIGDAIAQAIQSHAKISRREARRGALEMMERVGIRDPRHGARSFPHEYSGGMRQRIVIAMALASRPSLLLADEPTTALDVIVQAGILRLLDQLRREEGMSLLLVSHDISVIASTCDRIGIMYAGELVEEGPVRDVLSQPRHPYTQALIQSIPETAAGGPLPSIPGAPPEPGRLEAGCAFAPRCSLATSECREEPIVFLSLGEGRRSRCIHIDRLRVDDAYRTSSAERA